MQEMGSRVCSPPFPGPWLQAVPLEVLSCNSKRALLQAVLHGHCSTACNIYHSPKTLWIQHNISPGICRDSTVTQLSSSRLHIHDFFHFWIGFKDQAAFTWGIKRCSTVCACRRPWVGSGVAAVSWSASHLPGTLKHLPITPRLIKASISSNNLSWW